MERRIIRKRWQVTIPPGVRRKLNLFQGQLLNWDITTLEGETFIRLYTGSGSIPEDHAAFQDLLAVKKRRERSSKCGTKIGKLEAKRKSRVEEAEPLRNTELTTFKEIVSDLSQFLLNLQVRLNQS